MAPPSPVLTPTRRFLHLAWQALPKTPSDLWVLKTPNQNGQQQQQHQRSTTTTITKHKIMTPKEYWTLAVVAILAAGFALGPLFWGLGLSSEDDEDEDDERSFIHLLVQKKWFNLLISPTAVVLLVVCYVTFKRYQVRGMLERRQWGAYGENNNNGSNNENNWEWSVELNVLGPWDNNVSDADDGDDYGGGGGGGGGVLDDPDSNYSPV